MNNKTCDCLLLGQTAAGYSVKLHHDALLLEQANQSGTCAACFASDLMSDTWQKNLLVSGLPLIEGTNFKMLRNGQHVSETPLVHRREEGAELPNLRSHKERLFLLAALQSRFDIFTKM